MPWMATAPKDGTVSDPAQQPEVTAPASEAAPFYPVPPLI